MPRSKSRSGASDIGKKSHNSSVFSRTISATKLCRGGAFSSQIDASALTSLHDKKTPSKNSSLSEGRQSRVERDPPPADQARIAKECNEATKTNTKKNEPSYPSKAVELMMELEYLKSLLNSTRDEIKNKDEKIESLEWELAEARQIGAKKGALLDELANELQSMKENDKDSATAALVLEKENQIREMEAEVECEKEAKLKIAGELVNRTKELEASNNELEDCKKEIVVLHGRIESMVSATENENQVRELEAELQCEKEARAKIACKLMNRTKELELTKNEITVLHGNIESLEEASAKSSLADKETSRNVNELEEEIKHLEFEMKVMKENLRKAEEGERKQLLEVERLLDEMELLSEAEKKSVDTVEDLTVALEEVTREANQAKAKAEMSQFELDRAKDEVEKLKKLLKEAKQEADMHKNTTNRLRLEAEETFLAWNEKEIGFVNCVKRAEEDRAIALQENERLRESLGEAENMIREARGETLKLRGVLKQAVDEANAAKAAAKIARDENFSLQDRLVEKEDALRLITGESFEAAALELRNNGKDTEHDKNTLSETSMIIEDFELVNGREMASGIQSFESFVFETDAETVKPEPQTPKSLSSHLSSAFRDGRRRTQSGDYDRLVSADDNDDDDSDTDQSSSRRMSAVFRRVGDLLMIKRSIP